MTITSSTTTPLADDAVDRARRDADLLRDLHEGEGILVLPNAWDPMSAAIMAARGAVALATTSGGVSWALGRPDGHGLSLDEAIDAARRIIAAVAVPVSVDLEGGYGTAPADVARSVRAVVGIGAAGINLEDSIGSPRVLVGGNEQAARIAAARTAAADAGVGLVINARTDVFLLGAPVGAEAIADVLDRAARCRDAGADCLFVPGLTDIAAIGDLVDRSPLPLNILTGPGGLTVAQLSDAGVCRVTVGTAFAQSAYALVAAATEELLTTGGLTAFGDQLTNAELNGLMRSR